MGATTQKMSKLESEEIEIAVRLANLVNKTIDYSLERLTAYMSELAGEEVSTARALQVLEEHPEVLKPELIEEAIAQNGKAALFINIAMRMAGSLLKNDKQWRNELRNNGQQVFMLMMQRYRPDLVELLKDKPRLMQFLTNYILEKLGLI